MMGSERDGLNTAAMRRGEEKRMRNERLTGSDRALRQKSKRVESRADRADSQQQMQNQPEASKAAQRGQTKRTTDNVRPRVGRLSFFISGRLIAPLESPIQSAGSGYLVRAWPVENARIAGIGLGGFARLICWISRTAARAARGFEMK